MTKWKSNDFLYVKLRTRLDTIIDFALEHQIDVNPELKLQISTGVKLQVSGIFF